MSSLRLKYYLVSMEVDCMSVIIRLQPGGKVGIIVVAAIVLTHYCPASREALSSRLYGNER